MSCNHEQKIRDGERGAGTGLMTDYGTEQVSQRDRTVPSFRLPWNDTECPNWSISLLGSQRNRTFTSPASTKRWLHRSLCTASVEAVTGDARGTQARLPTLPNPLLLSLALGSTDYASTSQSQTVPALSRRHTYLIIWTRDYGHGSRYESKTVVCHFCRHEGQPEALYEQCQRCSLRTSHSLLIPN